MEKRLAHVSPLRVEWRQNPQAASFPPESRIEHLGHLPVATLYQESEWKSLLLVLSLLLGLSSLLVLRRLWSPSWWTESHRIQWS
jgi:hypothetical protein